MNATTRPADQARAASLQKGKRFCKVCFDAGKPETEYTSHYPRSDNELICPTLLNQSCLTCGQKGHTSSYCGKQRNPTTTKPRTTTTTKPRATPAPALAPAPAPAYNPKSNSFGVLTDDTDTDAKPQTMAERLKLLAQPNVQPLNVQPLPNKTLPNKTLPLPLPLLPPRPQFWWQDED